MTQRKRPELTPVIFRMLGGDVIAIFPTLPGDITADTCSSYMHVGQHGTCSPRMLAKFCRLAKPKEYRALKRELESAPYRYRLHTGMSPRDVAEIEAAAKRYATTLVSRAALMQVLKDDILPGNGNEEYASIALRIMCLRYGDQIEVAQRDIERALEIDRQRQLASRGPMVYRYYDRDTDDE